MHSIIYSIYKAYFDPKNTNGNHKVLKEELREGRELDDDEFDLQRYLRSLEDLLNTGSLSDANFALERIRFLGLRLSMKQYDEESDWFFAVDL